MTVSKFSLAFNFRALVLVALSMLCACSVRPNIPLGEVPVAERPDPSVVQQTKSLVQSSIGQQYKLTESGADYRRVKTIIDRLSKAAGAHDFTYPVLIADAGEDVNAMAVQDNVIVVYTELLRRVPNDDELATVLAHEVAHILAKHGADNTSKDREDAVSVGSSILGAAATIGASLAGAGSAASLAGDATEATAAVVGQGTLVRAYDRKLEYEADQVGLMVMAKAGYDPNGALRFWTNADTVFGGDTGGVFLSTHPSTGNRTERIQEALPVAMKYYDEWKAAQPKPSKAPAKAAAKKKKSS